MKHMVRVYAVRTQRTFPIIKLCADSSCPIIPLPPMSFIRISVVSSPIIMIIREETATTARYHSASVNRINMGTNTINVSIRLLG